jgi:cytochrome oxidase Cu insertion factor (SCO1/SenC/PrrC family)
MKLRILILACVCSIGFAASAVAQAPKSGKDKGGEKKAAAPKTPADLAFDAFNKARTEQGGKMDQPRFQRVIASGLGYLMEYPTHGRVNDAIRDLAFFGRNIDAKQPALRTAYSSLLKLDVTNNRYKEGLSEPVKAVLAALDAAIADNDVREAYNADNLNTFREKIDTLAETPGGARFLADRERSYIHVLILGSNSAAKGEAHVNKLLAHPEKSVVSMAREELNFVNAKKEPYELKFTALDGKPVDLAQLRGKVVAVYFWSAANKSSMDRMEALKQLHSTYRKRGLEFVSVSLDKEEDREKVIKAVKDNRVTWPVYFDGKGTKSEVATKLNVTGVPRLLVFDQKGILQMTMQGNPVGRLQADLPANQLEGMTKKLLAIK